MRTWFFKAGRGRWSVKKSFILITREFRVTTFLGVFSFLPVRDFEVVPCPQLGGILCVLNTLYIFQFLCDYIFQGHQRRFELWLCFWHSFCLAVARAFWDESGIENCLTRSIYKNGSATNLFLLPHAEINEIWHLWSNWKYILSVLITNTLMKNICIWTIYCTDLNFPVVFFSWIKTSSLTRGPAPCSSPSSSPAQSSWHRVQLWNRDLN